MENNEDNSLTIGSITDQFFTMSIGAPKYVGYYDIIPGEFSIYLRKKPNFIHRWFTRVLLGWKWKDTSNAKI